jgi:hypothetical protein
VPIWLRTLVAHLPCPARKTSAANNVALRSARAVPLSDRASARRARVMRWGGRLYANIKVFAQALVNRSATSL